MAPGADVAPAFFFFPLGVTAILTASALALPPQVALGLRNGKPSLNKKKVELFLRQDHLPVDTSRGLGKMGGFVETKGLTSRTSAAQLRVVPIPARKHLLLQEYV
jgi:hypothetical protein